MNVTIYYHLLSFIVWNRMCEPVIEMIDSHPVPHPTIELQQSNENASTYSLKFHGKREPYCVRFLCDGFNTVPSFHCFNETDIKEKKIDSFIRHVVVFHDSSVAEACILVAFSVFLSGVVLHCGMHLSNGSKKPFVTIECVKVPEEEDDIGWNRFFEELYAAPPRKEKIQIV